MPRRHSGQSGERRQHTITMNSQMNNEGQDSEGRHGMRKNSQVNESELDKILSQ